MWSASLSIDTSSDTEVHAGTPAENGQEYPDQQKRIYRAMQNSVVKGTREENGTVSQTGPALGRGGGTEVGV